MSIQVERLVPGDEHRLRAVRLRALEDAPDAFGATLEEARAKPIEEWRRGIEELATFVATFGGSDVGIARGARHDERSDTAYLISMWVAPKSRRQGVAAMLIDSVVAWATAEGFRRLLLDVTEGNVAAMSLYKKNGFVANGVLGTMPPPRQHIRECQFEKIL